MMIAENVRILRERVAAACRRVDRGIHEVALIAVSKTFDAAHVRDAVLAGVGDIGENYVQEACAKKSELPGIDARWHFIGHLQTNKVNKIAPWIDCIHGVDSHQLGKEIATHATRLHRTIDVLIEVNTSGEATKFGVQPVDVRELAESLESLSGIRLAGLMTIGPFLPDPEASRPSFRLLRSIRDEINQRGLNIAHLSMGMTNDFEVAIEEGATMIRIGTAIFGKRVKRSKNDAPASDDLSHIIT